MKRAQSRVDFPEERPAVTMDAREDQLIELAMRRAEEQLRDGTASSQVICHYLKLGSRRDRLEREIMEKQKSLIEAKTESLQSAQRVEELYAEAMTALTTYRSNSRVDDGP